MENTSAPIEVDPAMDDENPDYSSSGYDIGTASLAASINDYVFENGRRYHVYYGRDKNLLPDDEMEQDRLDLHHEIILRLMDGELHCAPLRDPKRILDIGTGTGIWSIDMADKHPDAKVVGTDLSPIQPGWVPPNCHFELDDFEEKWLFKPDSFDFIHARNIAPSVSNWARLLSEAFRCTKPGGYIELAEIGNKAFCDDGTMTSDDPIAYHFGLATEAMAKVGRPFMEPTTMLEVVEKAGYVDVQVNKYRHPLGPWPKDRMLKHVGALILLNGETGFHSYGLAPFTRILGIDVEEANRICSTAYESLKDKRIHRYNLLYVVWGRKPEREDITVEEQEL